MSDLIEKLRLIVDWNTPCAPWPKTKQPSIRKTCTDAISEIERLQSELDQYKAECEYHIQIKNRVPIWLSERITDLPSALTAISYLKQCFNNSELEKEKLQAECERLIEEAYRQGHADGWDELEIERGFELLKKQLTEQG